MGYSKFDIDNVRKSADIRDFVPGTFLKGNKTFGTCPECKAEGKFQVTHNSRLDVAKCWSCGFSISGAINAVMYYDGLKFPEAVKAVADRYGITIRTEEEILRENADRNQKTLEGSFCMQQLEASGLTVEDVTARVRTKNGRDWQYVPTFRKGGMTYDGNVNFNEDEMLIFYYDLYGDPMKVSPSGSKVLKDYVRARWSNPETHISKEGKPIKYQSVKGAEARFYFPQRIRDAFANKEHIETLVIQEGEKKAEKACKHGIMSIAIQGIFNIGNRDTGLIKDLQYLAKECSIKNIVLLFDSDWDNLSRSIQEGDDIDRRPTQFARAAIKFRDYVDSLRNVNIFVDIWFGHINPNDSGEKGIDDLLAGSLKGKEDEFLSDMQTAMQSHNGTGALANFHKISVLSDTQIYDFWGLRDKDKFFADHKEEIKDLKRFRFGKVMYVVTESGKIAKSMSSGVDREFWKVTMEENSQGKMKKNIKFDMMAALAFLEANGFSRIVSPEFGSGNYGFAHIEHKIARVVYDYEIRDYVFDHVVKNAKDRDLCNYFAENLGSILGVQRLERLNRSSIEEFYEPMAQTRYFSNGQIRITADDVSFGPIMSPVWEENVLKRKFSRVRIFQDIVRNADGSFTIIPTNEGARCEFLQYLMNVSHFWKDHINDMSLEEHREHAIHVVSKLTALGFLLTDYKFHSEDIVIICMDAKISDINQANGRSGKSLLCAAVDNTVSQAFINGKEANSDDYLLTSVTPRTRNILIDDLKTNFDIKKLFSLVTGRMPVNPKCGSRFEIPYEKAPRFLITTNYAINEDSDSAKDRMVFLMFSDWYNINHKPTDDFGHEFFHGWDRDQWNLFDNLMAECVMYFLRSRREGWVGSDRGVVSPPARNARIRQLRQKIGQAFLQWAEAYFSEDSPGLNNRKVRIDIYNHFCAQFPGQRQFVTSANFSTKLKDYCEYAGLHLNPHKKNKNGTSFSDWANANMPGVFIGDRDMSGGTEYYSVVTDKYARDSVL